VRAVKLCHLTLIHKKDLVIIQDGVQTVGDGQDGAAKCQGYSTFFQSPTLWLNKLECFSMSMFQDSLIYVMMS
jgi:hypothetical protein